MRHTVIRMDLGGCLISRTTACGIISFQTMADALKEGMRVRAADTERCSACDEAIRALPAERG